MKIFRGLYSYSSQFLLQVLGSSLMLQNATDLDLTAFVGVGLGEGSWEAFCKNSIISRQIVETTAKDFAGTNPRHETVILEFAFYEYSGRVVYHLLKQNGLGR